MFLLPWQLPTNWERVTSHTHTHTKTSQNQTESLQSQILRWFLRIWPSASCSVSVCVSDRVCAVWCWIVGVHLWWGEKKKKKKEKHNRFFLKYLSLFWVSVLSFVYICGINWDLLQAAVKAGELQTRGQPADLIALFRLFVTVEMCLDALAESMYRTVFLCEAFSVCTSCNVVSCKGRLKLLLLL